jgi:hypothetical protein
VAIGDDLLGPPPDDQPPPIELPPVDEPGPGSDAPPAADNPPTRLEPLPGGVDQPAPAATQPRAGAVAPESPIIPGSQRFTQIYPRDGGPNFSYETLPTTPDGTWIVVVRGGVNLIVNAPPPHGTVDVSADSAIIWRKLDPKKGQPTVGPNGEQVQDAGQPMEVYLEGNVIIRQDERKVAGNGDQKTYRAHRAFYDLRSERLVALDADLDMFAPGLIAPMKMKSPRIDQYRPLERAANGTLTYGLQEIRADRTMMTGSRFPNPGYRFKSRTVDVTRVVSDNVEPNTGRGSGNPRNPQAPQDLTWRIDARQNLFFLGPIPAFYWPRFVTDADDFDPPLRQIMYSNNNYLGNVVLTDWSGFKLLSIRKPAFIDNWNVDIDELSKRGPALGSEIGWFGKDFFRDLSDPYRKVKDPAPSAVNSYFGYFDVWGLHDVGRDVLGSGPAIVTNGPPGAGKAGFQRSLVPPFQEWRGRLLFRHMQTLLGTDADDYEDFHIQVEGGLLSDRYFLEEYYKRLNETGLDQETLVYLIRQKENWAWTLWGEANIQSWYTDTQWLPRADYYRLGDSLLSNWFTYYQHSGVDYANTHTASEVNNPNIFAFMPYDPISNTSRPFQSGRYYTTHELDLPLHFQFVRVVPYVQGQAVAWDNQINGQAMGRVWGAVGARAAFMAWKAYPHVENELLNVHGLSHKINFDADFRTSYSNVKLNQIGIQDDLDDNTYEAVRRYLALTNYVGGLLPPQYDPRHLILRRAISPLTGTTDVQASIETLQLGLHQRLQTKRGPEGRRRIIDYMTLDLSTTYFPNASRDNFNKSFGQNMYNWEWYIGDRTSIISYGWFEFFDIGGMPLFKTNVDRHNDPFGLNVITSGISISRPPRANIFLGYSVIDTGPITTSALNTAINYWLSPKWYGTYSSMYDFGNAILLAAAFSLTRIGADYLTTVGLTVDPQRMNYQFAFAISPRLSPNIRFGSATGLNQLDTRYAPTQ